MTALQDALEDLTHKGIERAADIPDEQRDRLVYLWSLETSMDDLIAMFAPPLLKSDADMAAYERLVLRCFHRYSGSDPAAFLNALDAHIWRQVEAGIDAALSNILAEES